jgi:hypothetical protein
VNRTPTTQGPDGTIRTSADGDSPPGPGLGVEITRRVCRPRKPRDSPLFQLVERHLEELLRGWPTDCAAP